MIHRFKADNIYIREVNRYRWYHNYSPWSVYPHGLFTDHNMGISICFHKDVWLSKFISIGHDEDIYIKLNLIHVVVVKRMSNPTITMKTVYMKSYCDILLLITKVILDIIYTIDFSM